MLSPKDPTETIAITFDLTNLVTTAIGSAVVTATHIDGPADSNTSAMISGAASISGFYVTQNITGGVAGATYMLRCTASADTYYTYVVSDTIQVVSVT